MDRSSTAPGRARPRTDGTRRSTLGLLAMLVASAGAATLLALRVQAVAPGGTRAVRTLGVETWVELVVLGAGLAAAVWTLLGTVAALLGVVAVRRGRPGRTAETVVGRWAPALVRRLARGAVGAGLGAGLALTPAAALADDHPGPTSDPAVVLDLGWESTAQDADLAPSPTPSPSADDGLPEPPAPVDDGPDDDGPDQDAAEQAIADEEPDVTDLALGGTQRTSDAVDETTEVVVVRGDTLWDIAARDLPERASPADVLRAVTAWHDVNRGVIGDDPDTILPGQVLRAP
jgi:resuscitation-promoting factor RpfA